jgi:NTP pyrophosphatase (non-canonical NTP hydrolase)
MLPTTNKYKNHNHQFIKTMKKLSQLIQEWANEKGINNEAKQELKLIEELGELAKEINLGNKENQKGELGDCFVVLVVLAGIRGEELDFGIAKCKMPNIRRYFEPLINTAFCSDCSTAISWLKDLATHLGHDLEECAQIAYDKISKRTGKTVDGQFIKD